MTGAGMTGAAGETSAMTFHGWTEEALDFYEGLAADNSKTYWTVHKPRYEELEG